MIITDSEFGEIIVRKSPLANSVKFSISTSGRLQMSVPSYTKDFLLHRFLESNRKNIKTKLPIKNPDKQRARDFKKKLLTKKAKEFLPYRLDYFAKLHGYEYSRLRLSHANTRWGSCSSNGTISLNIGLMQLPEPLIDYVILHELAHLNHMNHSKDFWDEVKKHDPNFKSHVAKLKKYTPGV